MKSATIIALSVSVLAAALTFASAQKSIPDTRTHPNSDKQVQVTHNSATAKPGVPRGPRKFTVPQPLRGVYSTAWIAGSPKIDEIISFMKKTNLNSLVIDVKDDTGIISFPSEVPLAKEIGARSYRIGKLKELLARLRNENIYTIARIVVFKDPLLAQKHTELAVLDKNGGLWRDFKGMIWLTPTTPKSGSITSLSPKKRLALGLMRFNLTTSVSSVTAKSIAASIPLPRAHPKKPSFATFCFTPKKT